MRILCLRVSRERELGGKRQAGTWRPRAAKHHPQSSFSLLSCSLLRLLGHKKVVGAAVAVREKEVFGHTQRHTQSASRRATGALLLVYYSMAWRLFNPISTSAGAGIIKVGREGSVAHTQQGQETLSLEISNSHASRPRAVVCHRAAGQPVSHTCGCRRMFMWGENLIMTNAVGGLEMLKTAHNPFDLGFQKISTHYRRRA